MLNYQRVPTELLDWLENSPDSLTVMTPIGLFGRRTLYSSERTYISVDATLRKFHYVCFGAIIPGSSKKTAINQKLQHPPKAPGPPVSMLLTIASQWPEQEWLFFLKAPRSTAVTQHWNWGQGVSNSPRQTSSWLAVFFEEPGTIDYLLTTQAFQIVSKPCCELIHFPFWLRIKNCFQDGFDMDVI